MSTSQDADLLFTKYGVYEGIIPYPSVDLMQIASGALTLEDFLVIGDIWSQLVHRYLSRPSHILDIGCGCARTARFLVSNAFVQSYTGFDVQPAAINWDQQHIQPYSRGRFAFVHSDVYNGLYNPSGTLSCSEYSFPVRSGSIDIAYAASLFTHLLEADCEHYLVETARALKPGSWLIASIHDQQIGDSAFVGSEARIDIHPDYFAKKAGAAGLQLESNLGYVGGQRIMVFRKLGPVSSVRRLTRWLFRRFHRTVTVGERRIDLIENVIAQTRDKSAYH
jgi:SAM-dependent methyltransferase